MAKNTVHKYWFLVSLANDTQRESFYISIPIVDKDALSFVHRARACLHVCFNQSNYSFIRPVPALTAYSDLRKGILYKSFGYAVDRFRDVLSIYYTASALSIIFDGF